MRVTLTVTDGPHQGQKFTFEGHDNFIVGRSEEVHFRLSHNDKGISRIHFMVEVNPPHCQLMDMGSRNGTYVNGEKVTTAPLKDGDVIKAGQTSLRVSVEDADATVGLGVATPVVAGRVESRAAPMDLPASTEPEKPIPAGRSCVVCAKPVTTAAPASLLKVSPIFSYLCRGCRDQVCGRPQPIKDHLLVKELGRGGMGVVYLGLRAANGVLTAIKTITPAIAADQLLVERFVREASILRELEHPHIVGFRDLGESNGMLYFAMDFVRGIDAGHLLRKSGPLPIRRAVHLTCQLLDALSYAHAKGFVHRDIKPANLLVSNVKKGKEGSAEEVVKLTDFGLSRVYQTSQLSGLTMAGQVAGTFGFMPPEQITHFRESKPTVDQYSAGAALYNLLTGKYVFDLPNDIHQKFLMILEQEAVPIQSRRADIPGDLAAIIHRSLAREAKRRFPDVDTMRELLLPFVK